LMLLRAGIGRHAGGIAQGDVPGMVRIKEGSARIASADRFQEYSVIYQQSLGADIAEDDTWEGEAHAVDPTVDVFRFSEIIAATEMDPARAQALAEWAARRATGFGKQATLVVPGFRDIRGKVWEPGNLVFVFSPFLKLEQDMVITNIIFSQDNERGSISTITVMNPAAYFGESSGQSGSGAIWDMPDFDLFN
ncbi:MAG: hypothetical protein L0287_13440, partial [Anaerolineae bacterium]|nr:hypothetical protein [Anaerolineae bacterium]